MAKSACVAFAGGCPRAQVDTALLFDYFLANGWDLTDAIEDADVVVVTSCAVEQKSEDLSFPLLEAADRRRNPDSTLVVVGCMAGILEERIHERFDAVAIPPRNAELMDDVIGATVKLREVPDPHDIHPRIGHARDRFTSADWNPNDGPVKKRVRRFLVESGIRRPIARLRRRRDPRDSSYLEPFENRYSVRVAWGCMGECAYCAIRQACGPLRSKPLDTALAEFDSGLREGHRQFRLVAQDLGAYGRDIGSSVVELLRALFEREGDFRLDVVDLNARWLVEYAHELVPLIARNAKRIRHLAVPTQSGSDRILRLMRRRHTASDARHVLSTLRSAAPDLTLSTHILVGFPSETERDFQDTLTFLRAIRFDRVDVYDYTDRPGTDASYMGDKVPRDVIISRSRRLRREFVGRTAGLKYWVRTRVESRALRRERKSAARAATREDRP